MQDDPFAELGLPAHAELTDDDVRAAWRRIAAATHPDREDGGDPARFGAAAAAYVLLKTPFGRGEALADLGGAAARGQARRPGRARSARRNWYPRPWPAPRSPDQRRGAHRLRAATPPASFRLAGYVTVDRGLVRPAGAAALGAAAASAVVGGPPATQSGWSPEDTRRLRRGAWRLGLAGSRRSGRGPRSRRRGRAGRAASVRARTSWAAVTPDPQ